MIVLSSLSDSRLADMLNQGRVGLIPTDTIYGLAARADNPAAVDKMSRLKQGDARYKPGTVIAAKVAQLIGLGVDAATVRRVAHLWPNPISIELPLGKNLEHLYQEGPHRAFRVVADAKLSALLEATGPLITTSANIHGKPPANSLAEAEAYFGDKLDFYVDGGDLSGHLPSTLAIFRDGQLKVLREGAVKIDEQGRIL